MGIDGHEVKTVTDAMQALACLEVFAPQVAIIDIGLPGMNGYELAAGIRATRTLREAVADRADGLRPGRGFRSLARRRLRSSLREARRMLKAIQARIDSGLAERPAKSDARWRRRSERARRR